MPRHRPTLLVALTVCALSLEVTSDVRAGALYNWLQFNGNPQHTGNNTLETLLSSGNVASLKPLFQVSLPAVVDGAPVVLTNVSTPGGAHNLVFLTTKDGHILALDAQTGATVWSADHGPGSCAVNNGSGACYTTSSPAIDPGLAYVYTYGLDGYAHKHAVGTGVEVTTGGWPELTTNKAYDEKDASALSFATASNGTSYLYVTHGGYIGDGGNYQGHVTTINLSSGAQNIFNALCSSQSAHFGESGIPEGSTDCAAVRSAIWARGGVFYDSALNKIYMATGNGDFNPSVGSWGDSVMALTVDGLGSGGEPLDTYTPDDYQTLENDDLDLGSTGPVILPTPASSNVSHLGLQSGKDGLLRLLNLANLSSQGGPGHTDGNIGSAVGVPQGGEVLTAIAAWVNPTDGSTWAFVSTSGGISGHHLAIDGTGNPSLTTVWQSSTGGTSPLVANDVLYYASSGSIRALAPTTGVQLWANTSLGSLHWQSPVVANAVIYIADQSANLTAFTLPPTTAVPTWPPTFAWTAAALFLGAGILAMRPRRAPFRYIQIAQTGSASYR